MNLQRKLSHKSRYLLLALLGLLLLARPGAASLLSPYTLQGRVELEGSSHHEGVRVTTASHQVQTGFDGDFEITAGNPYVLTASAPGYLSARAEGTFSEGVTSLDLGLVTLPGGDVTGDDTVNIFDLAYMAGWYGHYDTLADINRDGTVNLLDLALASSHYGQSGPVSFGGSPAPGPGGQVSGLVLDAGGSPVGGAAVYVTGTGLADSFVADSEGLWSAGSLPAGQYAFEAGASGHGSWPTPRLVTIEESAYITLTLAPLQNEVAGGDFEGGSVWSNWERFNGDVSLAAEAFDGQGAALLGDGPGQEVDCWQNERPGQLWTIRQRVDVPAIDRPGLSFVYKISTDQASFDYAWLEVVLMVDDQPHYLVPWGDWWQPTDWSLAALDLSPWQGQTVDLLFQGVNCSDRAFTALVDRVSIGAIEGQSAPTPPPSGNDFVGTYRQLTACENEGKHHLFIYVRDAQGNGIPGVQLRVYWPSDEVIIETGHKGEDPGLVDFPMFKGSYWVEVLDGSSDVIGPLTPDIPRDEPCEETGNPVGNSLYHYSYEVVFTRQ